MTKKHYIIPIFVSHKGCPHDCVFCNQKKITGMEAEIDGSDVEGIIREHLKTIDRKNAFVEVSFFGGSFTGIPIFQQNELLAVANSALNNGLIDAIRLSTRPDYINEEILLNLKNYNVKIIELGVQSMDDEVLIRSERGHTQEDVVNSSRLIKTYDFQLGLQMMIGLPGDNEEKDMETARKIIKLKPDFVRIYPTLVIRQTNLEEMFIKGQYIPLELEEAVSISKKLYKEFIRNKIDVIRLGLQVTEQINLGKDVVAGPFHPAFRELVESSLFNDMIKYVIFKEFKDSPNIEIWISPKDISKLYADKKRYFNEILKEFNAKNIKIRQSKEIDTDTLAFCDNNCFRKMSIYDYVKLEK